MAIVKEGETGSPTDAVLFFGISLVLGIACRHLLRGTRVPYTVALLILGIAIGSIGISLRSVLFICLIIVSASELFFQFILFSLFVSQENLASYPSDNMIRSIFFPPKIPFFIKL